MNVELLKRIEQAIRDDGRYPPDAYEFLHHGLERAAQQKFGGRGTGARRLADDDADEARHVSGQDLCEALRELAVERWGPLARAVLRTWNIRRTRDFGEMVYLMIRIGMMGKQDSDDISDFDNVYDFRGAFDHYEIPVDHLADDGPVTSGDEGPVA